MNSRGGKVIILDTPVYYFYSGKKAIYSYNRKTYRDLISVFSAIKDTEIYFYKQFKGKQRKSL